MAQIHATAIVDPAAELGVDVEIGPFAIVEAGARLGDRTKLAARVVIHSNTTLGCDNQVGIGSVIGGAAQDVKLESSNTFLEVGDRNLIREYATVHRSNHDGGTTRIGNDNFFMAFVHIGHDCILGNHIQMANTATLGGHCELHDRAIIGGLVAVHQRVSVGSMAMVAGLSALNVDVPPFCIVQGAPAEVIGLNIIGLRRNGIDADARKALQAAVRIIYKSKRNRSDALREVAETVPSCAELEQFLSFVWATREGHNGRQLER